MSIATKLGDDGSTGLMYNRRVPKTSDRVGAYGFVDELNSALGTVRCQEPDELVKSAVENVQDQLVSLMGELATAPEDRERYHQDGFQAVDEGFLRPLDDLVTRLESELLPFKGWAKPGENPLSASLDVARCVCRRAERQVCQLIEAGEEPNQEIRRYLNRLSDVLWLLARWGERLKEQKVGA